MSITAKNLSLEECCFCDEIYKRQMSDDLCSNTFYKNRIFEESDNYFAVPTVSPLTEGHALILPKKHITSLLQMKNDYKSEFLSFFNLVNMKIVKNFGETIFFEHGVGLHKKGGCGVTHAHLHILPINKVRLDHVKNSILEDYKLNFEINIRKFLNLNSRPENSYLMFGANKHGVYYYEGENIPSQYLRKKIAEKIGSVKIDWKEFFNWDYFNHTLAKLAQN